MSSCAWRDSSSEHPMLARALENLASRADEAVRVKGTPARGGPARAEAAAAAPARRARSTPSPSSCVPQPPLPAAPRVKRSPSSSAPSLRPPPSRRARPPRRARRARGRRPLERADADAAPRRGGGVARGAAGARARRADVAALRGGPLAESDVASDVLARLETCAECTVAPRSARPRAAADRTRRREPGGGPISASRTPRPPPPPPPRWRRLPSGPGRVDRSSPRAPKRQPPLSRRVAGAAPARPARSLLAVGSRAAGGARASPVAAADAAATFAENCEGSARRRVSPRRRRLTSSPAGGTAPRVALAAAGRATRRFARRRIASSPSFEGRIPEFPDPDPNSNPNPIRIRIRIRISGGRRRVRRPSVRVGGGGGRRSAASRPARARGDGARRPPPPDSNAPRRRDSSAGSGGWLPSAGAGRSAAEAPAEAPPGRPRRRPRRPTADGCAVARLAEPGAAPAAPPALATAARGRGRGAAEPPAVPTPMETDAGPVPSGRSAAAEAVGARAGEALLVLLEREGCVPRGVLAAGGSSGAPSAAASSAAASASADAAVRRSAAPSGFGSSGDSSRRRSRPPRRSRLAAALATRPTWRDAPRRAVGKAAGRDRRESTERAARFARARGRTPRPGTTRLGGGGLERARARRRGGSTSIAADDDDAGGESPPPMPLLNGAIRTDRDGKKDRAPGRLFRDLRHRLLHPARVEGVEAEADLRILAALVGARRRSTSKHGGAEARCWAAARHAKPGAPEDERDAGPTSTFKTIVASRRRSRVEAAPSWSLDEDSAGSTKPPPKAPHRLVPEVELARKLRAERPRPRIRGSEWPAGEARPEWAPAQRLRQSCSVRAVEPAFDGGRRSGRLRVCARFERCAATGTQASPPRQALRKRALCATRHQRRHRRREPPPRPAAHADSA